MDSERSLFVVLCFTFNSSAFLFLFKFIPIESIVMVLLMVMFSLYSCRFFFRWVFNRRSERFI